MQLPPRDRTGKVVQVGARVRLLSLSGQWLEELPAEEKHDVLSMIGEVFEVDEIDEYGHPWVRKSSLGQMKKKEVPFTFHLARAARNGGRR